MDGVSIAEFESDLRNNLYKVWVRMSSGSYFPPAVRAVEISKTGSGGGVRTLGVPTVADRIAQTVVARRLEARVESIFHPDSYGYRPGRSALHAVDPAACAEGHHRTEPCKQPCKRHKKCPLPCPVGCIRHAMYCPKRTGGVVEVDVKSKAGRRGIRLPDQLFDLLIVHHDAQAKERETAGSAWQDGDWMFTQPNGKPLDPRSDHDEWKSLLVEASVRDARLHDARHTAATVLLILGVPDRAVMDFMGWSNGKMKERYMHVVAAVRDDIAGRLGGFLWKTG